ncbi:MAG: hypothetical protein FWG98_00865 [Candidatus Cloacimonetes bacterium]|nr:hypothetical protein [Candidatus Cloacimonadota bacterium]
MLYKEKLLHCLKTEQNAINKMYLNELLINWNKVESAIEESEDSIIEEMITAISTFTKGLTVAKFKFNQAKKCGFTETHYVFQGHYLYDIVNKLLDLAGITENSFGLYVKKKNFHTGFRLERDPYKKITSKPKFELFTSGKYLNVGIELDFNYKMIGKNHYTKSKILVPLIVFYIEKHYNEKSFIEIKKLQNDVVAINQNAMLICLTESVDKKYLNQYAEIEKYLYVLRANFIDDTYNDLQLDVIMCLYDKLHDFAHKSFVGFDQIVPFGHVGLVKEVQIEDEPEEENE